MSWIEPKQDWKNTDIFLLEDWNRIVSNAQYLYNILGASYAWLDCSIENTASLPYYNIVNNLESNLENLHLISLEYGLEFNAVQWQPRTNILYIRNPSFEDFNRWEQFEYNLRASIYKITSLYSGNFTSGNNRIRQTLRR